MNFVRLILITGLMVLAGVACSGAESPKETTAPGSDACDPAYPSICIPSPPPDLDCGEISARRFVVLPPDPHGFDRDKDGVGCEQ